MHATPDCWCAVGCSLVDCYHPSKRQQCPAKEGVINVSPQRGAAATLGGHRRPVRSLRLRSTLLREAQRRRSFGGQVPPQLLLLHERGLVRGVRLLERCRQRGLKARLLSLHEARQATDLGLARLSLACPLVLDAFTLGQHLAIA